MSGIRLLSMNTSLSQARIFDESDDEEELQDSFENAEILSKTTIKEEPESPEEDSECDDDESNNSCDLNESAGVEVKKEPEEEEKEDGEIIESKAKVKEEIDSKVKVKQEIDLSIVKQECVMIKKETNEQLKQERNEVPVEPKRILKRCREKDVQQDTHGNNNKHLRVRSISSSSSLESCTDSSRNSKRRKVEYELDPAVLQRRQKQIDYGKNTRGYDNYITSVPKNKRKKTDPQTPNKYLKYSRRGWDGLIKQWRIRLHQYDSSS